MLYTHDCDTCTYLGTVDDVDLYVHTGKGETYIARNSSDGPDYESGKVFVGLHKYITIAHAKARQRGIGLEGVGQ